MSNLRLFILISNVSHMLSSGVTDILRQVYPELLGYYPKFYLSGCYWRKQNITIYSKTIVCACEPKVRPQTVRRSKGTSNLVKN
jgi:hypothetical protein